MFLEFKMYSAIFCIIIFTVSVFTAHLHTHTHTKERVEDGAFSPKMSSHNPKKTESEFTHEVMLGSTKEADEFDTLSPEESKRRLSLLVSKIDANGNQFIEADELFQWIIKSFKRLSEEEANERFEEADLNKDDQITWKEQLLDSFGEDSSFEDSIDEDELVNGQMIKADKQVFKAADKNKDGVLDKEEYKRYCNPEEYGDMLPVLIQNTLEEKDINKDGFISFEEYVGDKEKLNDKEYAITEKESFESNYDKNKDGLLNSEEILNWIVPNASQIAAEETRHLLAAADENHDSLLSYEEVINNYDVFVGSEVTDFGEHLENIREIMDEL